MIEEHFKNQVNEGATEMFFYGLERPEPFTISIQRHRGTLDTFPTNLEYVRHLTDGVPLFKEVE
jgi:hypothetical protein